MPATEFFEEAGIPDASLLFRGQYDYIDCYSAIIKNNKQQLIADTVVQAFFSSAPSWIENLFLLRNRIAKIIGLKIPVGKVPGNTSKIVKGSTIGLFKIFEAEQNEVIMGENDKHLDFRVSLLVSPAKHPDRHQHLYITTVVKFNNRLGKCYFLPVKPLHKIIVPVMLRNIVRRLEA